MSKTSILIFLIFAIAFIPISATEIDSGFVSGDWYASGNPYNINGEITVHTDSTLNIHEGVEVIFQGHYKLIVNGFLEAVGTESDSILFTAADTSEGWHGIRFVDAPDSSHLSYCIIKYGRADGATPDDCGGGILCLGSNPVINHCMISDNSTSGQWGSAGGGISCQYYSNPNISCCVITGNWTSFAGGGIDCEYGSSPTIDNCIINGNYANNYSGGINILFDSNPIISNCIISDNSALFDAGGIGIGYHSSPTIINSVISGNSSTWNGGGIVCARVSDPIIIDCTINGNLAERGAGIFCSISSDPIIINNTISQNSAIYAGGGFYSNNSNPRVNNNIIVGNSSCFGGGICCVLSNAVIINNTISGNSADSSGGGIDCYESSPMIQNNTISGNSVILVGGGGINIEFNSYPTITNNIFWGDTAPNNPEIQVIGSNPTITYCNIQGGWEGEGNIDLDPLFRDTISGDYHLMATYCDDPYNSPCIDMGHPDILDSLLDCGWGLGMIRSDMGAFAGGDSVMVSIPQRDDNIPAAFYLSQNYPNPFNAITNIQFNIPTAGHVTLEIYNILGQRIETLIDNRLDPGSCRFNWDASQRSSGIYFYKLTAGDITITKRMMLLK